jgi:flagellar motor switch protein FliM
VTEHLTQPEVDALVRRGGSPPLPFTLVLPWSFHRPARLVRERRLMFESVLSETARGWQSWLASRLQLPVEVAPDAVESVPLSEWLESFDEPASAFGFRIGGSAPGSGVVDLGAGLAFAFVDRLLGGPGDPVGPRRPLTALEQALVRGPVERLLAEWRDACRPRLAVEPAVTSFEPTPGTISVAASDASMLVSHLAVRGPEFSGLVAVGVPLASLEPTLARTSAPAPAVAAVPPAARARLEHGLQQARVTLALRMPVVRLSTRSVLALAPGQVLRTGTGLEGAVELHVNGKACFVGSLGQRRNRLALRIQQAIAAGASTDAPRRLKGRVQ